MPGGPLGSVTCRDYVLPQLKAGGWSGDQIVEQFPSPTALAEELEHGWAWRLYRRQMDRGA